MGLWRRRDGPGRATLVHDVVRRPQPDADELVRMVDDGHDFRGSVVISASRAPEPADNDCPICGRLIEIVAHCEFLHGGRTLQ